MKILLKFPFITILIVITMCSFLYALLYRAPKCASAERRYTIGEVTTYYSNRFNAKYYFQSQKFHTRIIKSVVKRQNINVSSFFGKKFIISYGVFGKEADCSSHVSRVIPEEVLGNIEVPEEGWKEVPAELRGYLLPE